MTMSNNNLASSDSLLAYCLAQSSAAYNATSNNATTDTANDHNNTILLLDCITRALQNDAFHTLSFARSVLLVYAAALVFFMQAGFAMVCAGAVRTKNVQNTLLKNLLDACGASIAFFSVGYAFAFGGAQADNPTKTFLGTSQFFLMNVDDLAFWLFQYAFSAASATIIAGTLAERCQMTAYLCYSVMLVGWVYPIILHAIWNPQGFLCAYSVDPLWGVGMVDFAGRLLRHVGWTVQSWLTFRNSTNLFFVIQLRVDFAGSGVVHLTGGITALFATIILGPRRGRFHDETGRRLKVPRDFPGHSMSLQMLGTIILWFGWYGFNCGSALTGTGDEIATVVALAGVNSTMSGGTAGIVALFVNLYLLERYTGEPYFDLKYAMNGSLSGLVAITGSCGTLKSNVHGRLFVGCNVCILRFVMHFTAYHCFCFLWQVS
jgi:Amt family ammonium transporter